jgi:hypothetical protein
MYLLLLLLVCWLQACRVVVAVATGMCRSAHPACITLLQSMSVLTGSGIVWKRKLCAHSCLLVLLLLLAGMQGGGGNWNAGGPNQGPPGGFQQGPPQQYNAAPFNSGFA